MMARLWLVPLAAGPTAGAAGLAILPMAHGPLTRLAGIALLILPVIVLGLVLTFRQSPGGLASSTASCGASPLQTLLHARLRPALPGIVATLALALLLACLAAPLLAPLAVTP